MIKTVPYGLHVGQIIEPLVASEMTNGKIALARARYEVRVIYPGGVIVRSAAFVGQLFPGQSKAAEEIMDESALLPGGLLRVGTPVHAEGDPDPTDEELARLVNAGVLHTSILTKDVSDASDFAGLVPGTGVWDYRISPARRVRAPRQAATICDILVETGKSEFLESEVLRLVREQGARLNTRQDPTHIFRYYKKDLVAAGFLLTKRDK